MLVVLYGLVVCLGPHNQTSEQRDSNSPYNMRCRLWISVMYLVVWGPESSDVLPLEVNDAPTSLHKATLGSNGNASHRVVLTYL